MQLEDLRKKRQDAGLTQIELAKLIGISRSSLSLIERGERKPSYEVMKKISQALNEPVEIV